MKRYITLATTELNELFDYHPMTGHICYKDTDQRAFDIAHSDGTLYGYYKKQRWQSHRVAWAMFYWQWPNEPVRHKNGDKHDNRLCNLYLASNSQQEAMKNLTYNPDTGEITNSNGKRMFNTQSVKGSTSGHLCGTYLGQLLAAHRVAWAIHYGAWPSGDVMHANGNKHDNRIANLRMHGRLPDVL